MFQTTNQISYHTNHPFPPFFEEKKGWDFTVPIAASCSPVPLWMSCYLETLIFSNSEWERIVRKVSFKDVVLNPSCFDPWNPPLLRANLCRCLSSRCRMLRCGVWRVIQQTCFFSNFTSSTYFIQMDIEIPPCVDKCPSETHVSPYLTFMQFTTGDARKWVSTNKACLFFKGKKGWNKSSRTQLCIWYRFKHLQEDGTVHSHHEY